MFATVRTALILSCALLPLSCGGSGGGGAFVFTPALFAGPYHSIALAGDLVPTEHGTTSWSTLTSNGISALSVSAFTQNDNRVVGPAGLLIGYTYTVSAAGDMEWIS